MYQTRREGMRGRFAIWQSGFEGRGIRRCAIQDGSREDEIAGRKPALILHQALAIMAFVALCLFELWWFEAQLRIFNNSLQQPLQVSPSALGSRLGLLGLATVPSGCRYRELVGL